MEKVILGNALRERLLRRLEDTLARPHDDWVQLWPRTAIVSSWA